jgi:hypothetical protein
VDVLARPEKLKKLAQISTKRRRKAFLFSRKSTRRLSTEDWRTLKDFAYMPRQLILKMVQMESETYRLKVSDKTRPQISRNSVVFRFFVRVLRHVRKWIRFKPFFLPCKRKSRTRKERNRRSKDSHGGHIRRVMLSSGGKGSGSLQKTQEGLTDGSRT